MTPKDRQDSLHQEPTDIDARIQAAVKKTAVIDLDGTILRSSSCNNR